MYENYRYIGFRMCLVFNHGRPKENHEVRDNLSHPVSLGIMFTEDYSCRNFKTTNIGERRL